MAQPPVHGTGDLKCSLLCVDAQDQRSESHSQWRFITHEDTSDLTTCSCLCEKQNVIVALARLEALMLRKSMTVRQALESRDEQDTQESCAMECLFGSNESPFDVSTASEQLQARCVALARDAAAAAERIVRLESSWVKLVHKQFDSLLGAALVSRIIGALEERFLMQRKLNEARLSEQLQRLRIRMARKITDYERSMRARETAHTVKNLNTIAHHKLVELLDSDLDVHVRRQVQQVLAIVNTAAHQTYQLNRVVDILRGTPPDKTCPIEVAVKEWRIICGKRFHLGDRVKGLLVDRFRLVAVLSNAWNNALDHGDSTRMHLVSVRIEWRSETSVTVVVENPALPGAAPITVESMRELLNYKANGSSSPGPRRRLSTGMGLLWIRQLCLEGQMSLVSEGFGRTTVLRCCIECQQPRDSLQVAAQKHMCEVPEPPSTESMQLLAKLCQQFMQKCGVIIVEDSHALGLQLRGGFLRMYKVTNLQICGGRVDRRSDDINQLLGAADTLEQILVVLDRNLGSCFDPVTQQRQRMIPGDRIGLQLRRAGYWGCIMLHTGDSKERLDEYRDMYHGFYIDSVLDKHHAPCYRFIFEGLVDWLSKRLNVTALSRMRDLQCRLEQLLTRLLVLLPVDGKSQGELVLVDESPVTSTIQKLAELASECGLSRVAQTASAALAGDAADVSCAAGSNDGHALGKPTRLEVLRRECLVAQQLLGVLFD